MGRIIQFLAIVILVSCSKEVPTSVEIMDTLVLELSKIEEVKKITKEQDGLIFLKTKYCIDNNIESLFASSNMKVKFMKLEELFMRRISSYLKIEKIEINGGDSFFDCIIKIENETKKVRISYQT